MLEYIKILKFMLVRDHIMKKHFKAVELKYLDDSTIMKIREWRNRDFVRKNMFNSDLISEEQHIEYIEKIKKDSNRGLFVFYLDDVPFGVYQYIIYPEGNYIMDGNYLIDEEYQYMGYGLVEVYFMNIIKFEYFHCNKGYGEVLDINKRTIMLNEKLKIVREGVLRQQCIINDEYHDVYCYGLLKEEWSDIKEHLKRLISAIIDEQYDIYL